MAKITLELPDWADERNIRIFAGIELIAEKLVTDTSWRVKDKRCIQCGNCCRGLDRERSRHLFPVIDGICIHLIPEPGTTNKFRCAIALDRPWGCQVYPSRKLIPKSCSLTFKELSD